MKKLHATKREKKEFLEALKKKYSEDVIIVDDSYMDNPNHHEYATREIHPTLITWGKP